MIGLPLAISLLDISPEKKGWVTLVRFETSSRNSLVLCDLILAFGSQRWAHLAPTEMCDRGVHVLGVSGRWGVKGICQALFTEESHLSPLFPVRPTSCYISTLTPIQGELFLQPVCGHDLLTGPLAPPSFPSGPSESPLLPAVALTSLKTPGALLPRVSVPASPSAYGRLSATTWTRPSLL